MFSSKLDCQCFLNGINPMEIQFLTFYHVSFLLLAVNDDAGSFNNSVVEKKVGGTYSFENFSVGKTC